MKKAKKIILATLIASLTVGIAGVGFVSISIPDKIYIMQDSEYRFTKFGIFSSLFSLTSVADSSGTLAKDGTVSATRSSYSANVSMLNVPIKKVNVNVIQNCALIPCGTPVGVKMYADGLEILRSESFVNTEGKSVSPCDSIPFKKGDVITEVNGNRVKTINQFSKEISRNKDNVATLKIQNSKKTYTATVVPQKEKGKNQYRVGLVVRDSIAGIGTLTYCNPSDGTFGALGHGIEDSDTDIIFPLSSGSVEEASILSVSAGKKGVPGQMHGMFTGANSLGKILSNSSNGIFGKMGTPPIAAQSPTPVASMSEVKKGKAHILCTVSSEGVQKFDIEIEKIMLINANTSKGMVIKITDSRLLSLTGGIVQGMSGSPIIQNGKIVGAVTHVFVNDPTRGYGIFIENMLSEAEKIK